MSQLRDNNSSLPSKEDVARTLAKAHRDLDPGIIKIYRLVAPDMENDPSEPIKLLEINKNTIASGVMPVYFTPHAPSGVPYPSVVIELHPSEWPQSQDQQPSLPNGWRLDGEL